MVKDICRGLWKEVGIDKELRFRNKVMELNLLWQRVEQNDYSPYKSQDKTQWAPKLKGFGKLMTLYDKRLF